MMLRPLRPRSALGELLAESMRMASAGVDAAVTTTALAAGVAGSAALLGGVTAARTGSRALRAIPGARTIGRVAAAMAVEAAGGPAARRSSHHPDDQQTRRWIEVRGLSGPDADAIADEVLTSVQAVPGVLDAVINRSVARVVVTVGPQGPARSLTRVVAEAERRAGTVPAEHRPLTLPGDDSILISRAIGAAAAAVGLGVSLTGAAMRLPGLPDVVSVVPAVADNIPVIRHQIQRRLGNDGTDLVFSILNSTAAALTVSPSAAAAEAASRAMLAVEAWNARLAWHRHESELARCCPEGGEPAHGTAIFADGPGEEYSNRAGRVGLIAAAVAGAVTRNPTVAGAAALVTTPKPARAAREAFGCAMTRGLTAHHDAVVVRPRALRALDRVDVIVLDPRSLYTDTLTISRVRGVDSDQRARAWEAARAALARGGLGPGWHKLSSIPGAGRAGSALVSPVRDPMATAVVAEARRARVRVVSVDDDGLRSLAQGFDTLVPASGSLDASLADLIDVLHAQGATVALVTTSEMAARHGADVTIGISRHETPPWGADIFVADLPAVWRILRSIPAARTASARGVRLSMSGTAIGALMLVPGVPGFGPEAVNVSALTGLWAGFRSGSAVFRDAPPAPEPGHEWHALSVREVRTLLPRPADSAQPPGRPPASRSLVGEFFGEMRANLNDPITPILATGAVASALLGSPLDAVLVGGVLLANSALSAQQQMHAERILRRLLAVQEPSARRRVGPLRAGEGENVAAGSLRPGDIIEVRTGDVVPADARLIEASTVEVDESTLTGESLPVPKQTAATPGAPLAERSCMIYAGTTVVAGSALAVVTSVGRTTEIRRALAMTPTRPRQIGLQRQLSHITNRALPWSMAGGALVGLAGVLRGTALREAVGSAVAVTVAAVPEGLPLVATLAQLAAARRLTGEHVLIRNANSIEALARLGVVCFDKTGTLSENRLRVKHIRPFEGYSVAEVIEAALSTVTARDGFVEHATDEAIRQAATAAEAGAADVYLPFQSGRPFAAALTGTRLTVKGAPEVLAGAQPTQWAPMITELAADGLRVIAVAERQLTARQAARAAADPAAMERLCRTGLNPIGLLGLADTLRAEAAPLLAELRDRGIPVRLLTGDHPATAAAIAGELGLPISSDEVVTGSDWESLSADERIETVRSRLVFARMSPEHKVEVVQTLERAGLVTAMVGDGANDAAAIRAASVGVGVAAAGSDPARTAADVILVDGRVEALIDAIDEGEQLWRRVQSAVSVLLGGNAGEVAFALITSLLTGRSVLNARQMLLVNMLTDALPAAALAVSRQDGNAELDRDEAALWRAIAARGAATTTGATLAWTMARLTGPRQRAATVALIGLVSTQLAQTVADSQSPLVVSTAVGSFLVLAAVISTPVVSQFFGCTPVDPLGWGQAFLGTAVASALAAVLPELLRRRATGAGSVVEDDDPGAQQQGVEVLNGRGQQPDSDGDQGVGSGSAQDVVHESRQTTRHDRNGSTR